MYEYDGNGNITKKGATTYTYDTVIKDRLVKVGNTPVTYSTANPLNPATYGNCSYNFKGRRLQSFTKSGSTYNYIYDEQGLRTRKIAPDGSVTKYLYNGTKLAAEIAPNYRLDFLYDENDMLYGFVKDGSANYFYARDMLQNILGIIDTNGSPVVIYQYTAYGTSTVLQDTAGLASINPFRFKGYYFDSESGMYYCHTRYYVPEWCRWLNSDHPSFLQPESLQEMNLYAYCGNNPVVYTDESGTMQNWAKWLIGGLIILGLGIATVATGGAAAGIAGFIVAGAFKGAVIGAVSGALVSGTISGISSANTEKGFWNGFADGAADGFMSGAIVGGITGAISSSIQVANAAKAWVGTGGKTSFQQMTEHYMKHVIKEGQKSVAKNIVNYTKQAKAFFANNSTSGYLLRKGVIKIDGAPGGIFNTDGLIRSFWYVRLQMLGGLL